MNKKTSKRLMHQKIALGIAAVFILALLGWMSTLVVMENLESEFQEGVHYQLLENPRRIRGNKLEVMEFFSYGCIHCFNFDPEIHDWVRQHKDDVNFIRTPTFSNEFWRLLARNYYTMQQLGVLEENHYPFFVQIHSVRKDMSRVDAIADWIDGKGTSASEYLRTFNSSIISNRLNTADSLQRRLRVASVPSLIVNGKYHISVNRNVGLSRMLDVLDYLLAKEEAEKTQVQNPAPSATTTPKAES